jgi:hypothetical protein
LRPLIVSLRLQDDREVDHEVRLANERLAQGALAVLDGDPSTESQELRHEFALLLEAAAGAAEPSRHDQLRVRIVREQRRILVQMRMDAEIGDDAFHRVEAKLDLAELNARADQTDNQG